MKKVLLITLSLVSTIAIAATVHSPTSQFTTINGKILCGYQGWFSTPTDGASQGWKHYSANSLFEPGACKIDMWPDMREYDPSEQYATAFTSPDGTPATVFSSYRMKTSMLHFRWMDEYGLDGVVLQRFVTNIRNSGSLRNFNDTVLVHTMRAAQAYNKSFCIMYDMTSMKSVDTVAVKSDWQRIITNFKLTTGGDDQCYLYHKGKPVVCLWGVGFDDGRHDPASSSSYSMNAIKGLVEFFKNDPVYGDCTVLLGVNYSWRTATKKAYIDDYLFDIIKKADIINPWLVGRLKTINDMSSFASNIEADMNWCLYNGGGIEYMPCAFPGFAWYNMYVRDNSKNNTVISRDQGNFLWRQFHTAIAKNVKQIYATMFDEIDESTALFKVTDTPPNNINDNNVPAARVGSYPPSVFQTMDGLPSDHYLWLVGEASRMLRKESVLSTSQPVRSNKSGLGVGVSSEYVGGDNYKITFTGSVGIGKLYCSSPYVVEYGAPAFGKKRDARYFGTGLSSDGVIVSGENNQTVSIVKVNSEDQVIGFGSVSLQSGTAIATEKNGRNLIYYDSINRQMIIKLTQNATSSVKMSIISTSGVVWYNQEVNLENNKEGTIPVILPQGFYMVQLYCSGNHFYQKIIVN